ncbi:MAG: hybrid sensor histidine kinase/response regulator [Brevundimonas sp.]|uniref:hybrid sensor histidine kinase/response regulator n=1 Tax=Brevundimonas sp. TaxID=1871086 RepID=UPI0024887B7D|nr:hybrid sensor histidine kinase/response regulator [Brevundimonas sp.]MDI1327734.1 hybrid sensor histidine kinase/response regulator [Brevundimonas sp.]
MRPTVAPLSVETLFSDLRREFTPLAEAKGLSLNIAPSRLWAASDRDLLRSLLQNLIGNAIRYTDRGGVLVGARRAGGMVRFEIHDTGRGIAPEQQELIFTEFTRLPGRSGDEPGAGLGLAIVRRVAELLGHPLELRSTPGRGATFTVSAPRARAPRSSAEPGAKSAPTGTGRTGLRVLCVDNEPAILEALVALLGRWGMKPVTAPDAAAALDLAGPFDAALIDLHLGDGADGLSLVAALRARGLTHIALITADADETVPARAAAAGAALMSKPVKPAALKAFLSRHRAEGG